MIIFYPIDSDKSLNGQIYSIKDVSCGYFSSSGSDGSQCNQIYSI